MTEDKFIQIGDVELCYRRTGDPEGLPLLLVMGLGAQMTAWPPEFVAGFADRYFDVVLFDNRDIGLSTNFNDQGPTAAEVMGMANGGDPVELPYTLADMAADAAGLIDALELGPTHIVGASMGGMIVQQMAIDFPDKVASLTSIMSTTGSPEHGQPTPEAIAALSGATPTEREAGLDAMVEDAKIWASPEWWDPAIVRERLGANWDRTGGLQGDGTMRQLGAIMMGGSREEGLAKLDVPTLVVHGDTDTLVTPSGGDRTAEIIPGAELMVLEGMGHDLPPIYWQQITEGVLQLAVAAAS